jgi:hypothetical protein
MDFGLVEFEGGVHRIIAISTAAQASAALRLIDQAIGYADGARVPYQLDLLLEHIRTLAPDLQHTPPFERLRALSRR